MNADRLAILERHGRAYAELGLAIAFTDGLDGPAAKIARNWKATKPLPDPDFGAALLAGRGASRNPVVVLGASNMIGVDLDGESGRNLSRVLVPGGWPKTVAVRSGRIDGGLHLWFRPPAGAAPAKVELSGDGLEIAADGYLVCPPSLHANGRPYTFAEGRAPWETALAVLPPSILHGLEASRSRSDEAERGDEASPIPEGGRHRHLRRIGCAMRRAGARRESIEAALLEENRLRADPRKDRRTIVLLAEDIATRYPPGART